MKIKLGNRLEVLMKDSGINTFEEMAQRLTENQGWPITRTALSRKFRSDDVSLSLSMIEAICNELQCMPGDLFETNITDASEEFVEELRSRLQPFRYGVIRLQRQGSDTTEERSADTDLSTKKESKRTKSIRVKQPENIEDIVGPKVSHLHAGKIKND
ncbi:helix-turn-helix domain-containing protein [Pseudomonas aeruginosa]|uniref:helix-turn-helix domain-containing protein n=1 Tax=Pseudomonas aeruginosa TaxID=287 RepID=UPI003D26A317